MKVSKYYQKGKKKLLVTNLAFALILSGCSFSLGNSKQDTIKSNIEVEDIIDDNNEIDELMGFKNNYKNINTYDYLIDNSDNTTATFAALLEEKTISNDTKFFDEREEASIEVFNNPIINPITIPKPLVLDHIYEVSDLVGSYGNCDITCKKLISLNGEIYYYIKSIFTFDSAGEYLIIGANSGDTIEAEYLYRVDENNELELLYRNQTGVSADTDNVIENNYNNSNQTIIVPIEETVFSDMNGSYNEEYLREALDVYSGTDDYYDPKNDGEDFTKFIQ